VLLAETLRSTTFKLALISIGVFGAVVIVLFGYVYWLFACRPIIFTGRHYRSKANFAEDYLS
jgi:hypothetical protein